MDNLKIEAYKKELVDALEKKGISIIFRKEQRVNILEERVLIRTDSSVGFSSSLPYLMSSYPNAFLCSEFISSFMDSEEWKIGNKMCRDFVPNIDEFLPKQVMFQVVNAELNRALLSDVPHRLFLDLAVIYRYIVNEGESCISSYVIHNSNAERFGITEQELFDFAKENAKFETCSLFEVVSGLTESSVGEQQNDLIILSNQQKRYGAAIMLFPEFFEKVANGHDLIILPSSVHEVLAYENPQVDFSTDNLVQMVDDINKTQLSQDEYLSSNIYLFRTDTSTIEKITDVPALYCD